VKLRAVAASRGGTGGSAQLPMRHCERSAPPRERRAATCVAPSSRGMIWMPCALKCALSVALTMPPSHGPKQSARTEQPGWDAPKRWTILESASLAIA